MPLPGAERQVQALEGVYGREATRVYVGRDATEGRARSEAPGSRVLHFATHAVMNDRNPMYSHILLAPDPTGDEGGHDGLLEAWEILDLRLDAELVVLSACETALGRVGAGEGVIGLSWAFFMAGAPALVVSQWKVEAASTNRLMTALHRVLGTASPDLSPPLGVAPALQEAAKDVLREGGREHPFYWAGFSVIGDGR